MKEIKSMAEEYYEIYKNEPEIQKLYELRKIEDERIFEHQKIRYLLQLYDENTDKNKYFPFDLAYRIYNISSYKLINS